jgi:hypothetical protein
MGECDVGVVQSAVQYHYKPYYPVNSQMVDGKLTCFQDTPTLLLRILLGKAPISYSIPLIR